MTRDTSIVKTIDYVERLNNSYYGNPRFKVHFTDGTSALTMSDVSVNYGLANATKWSGPVEVTMSRAGRIRYIKPVGSF